MMELEFTREELDRMSPKMRKNYEKYYTPAAQLREIILGNRQRETPTER